MSQPTPTAEMLMEKISRLPIAATLSDPAARRRLVFERLAASDDPVAREMGQQLRDGTMRVRDMWAVPAYRQVLERGIRKLESFDLHEFNDQLDTAVAQYESDRERDPEAADAAFERHLHPEPRSGEDDDRRDQR
jgi:hypothetical protein